MGLLATLDNVFTGNVCAFLKRPPTDDNVQRTLLHFKINVMDYEVSFNNGNPFWFTESDNIIERVQIKRPKELKVKFTTHFHRFIEDDEWYGKYLFVADTDVETTDNLPILSTVSSTSIYFNISRTFYYI
jgi:hypothetical protein